MRISAIVALVLVCSFACTGNQEDRVDGELKDAKSAAVFDKAKWKTKDSEDYPYRESMLNDVVYNDTVRTLNRDEVIHLLGEPDRTNEGHLYYLISQKRIASWPLHKKFMVIKISGDTIEWIKIHE